MKNIIEKFKNLFKKLADNEDKEEDQYPLKITIEEI